MKTWGILAKMNIVLLGPPGIGKGTAASELSKKLGMPHISTGDILRENVAQKTKLGVEAKSYMDKGLLVPDKDVIKMVNERLKKADCKNGFILDGFPRTINQAEEISKNIGIDKVVNIQASDNILISRLSKRRICKKCSFVYNLVYIKPKKNNVCDKCSGELYQREDDKPKAIKERLKVYKNQTKPLIDYYIKQGILVNVDGSGTPKEEFEAVLKAVS